MTYTNQSPAKPLVPAKAGTQKNSVQFQIPSWIPAYAGMSG
jgi:hypothetical protein